MSATDTPARHWSHTLPTRARPFADLSRLDRPVGYWLLALPGWIGIVFGAQRLGIGMSDVWLAGLILAGAIAMRGAGCTYNDIVDRDLDAAVARTATRPLPSGAVSPRAAWLWIGVQCAAGLIVLLLLPNRLAQIVSLAAIPLVAAYPFMKRITWWPQIWLGLTFNWAVLVTLAATQWTLGPSALVLYAGLACWTVGYDTIYACQDIEDDALAGIRSSARAMDRHIRAGVGIAYGAAAALIGLALWLNADPLICVIPQSGPLADSSLLAAQIVDRALALWPVLPFAAHLAWQVARLDPDRPQTALVLFKSNSWAAGLLIAGLALNTLI